MQYKVIRRLAAFICLSLSTPVVAAPPLVDKTQGFALDWPGPGWSLLGASEAASINPQASAIASHVFGIRGMLLIDHLPGRSLDEMIQMLIDHSPLTKARVVARMTIQLGDLPAQRLQMTGQAERAAMYVDILVAKQGDFFYQLAIGGEASNFSPSSPRIAELHKALRVLPGARELKPPSGPDVEGPGWTLRDGVLRSTIDQLQVNPVEGVKIRVGAEVAGLDHQAVAWLITPDETAYLVLSTFPEHEQGAAEMKDGAANFTRACEEMLPSWTGSIGGEPVKFQACIYKGVGLVRAYTKIGDRWLVIFGQYQLEPPTVQKQLAKLLSGVRPLTQPSVLAESKPNSWRVGKGASWRGQTVRFHDAGLTLVLPPGDWRGAYEARDVSWKQDRIAIFQHARSGVELALEDMMIPNFVMPVHERLGIPAFDWQAEVRAHLKAEGWKLTELTSSVAGYLGTRESDPLSRTLFVPIEFTPTRQFLLSITAPAPIFKSERALIDQLASAVRLGDKPFERSDRELTDRRFGLRMQLPEDFYWSEQPTLGIAGSAHIFEQNKGQTTGFVVTMLADDPALVRVQNYLRERVADVGLITRTITEDTVNLAGFSTIRTSWISPSKVARVAFIRRGNAIYGLFVEGPPGSWSAIARGVHFIN